MKLQPIAAAASVILGVVAGALVNLATSDWTWAVGAALAVVVITWATLAYAAARRSSAGAASTGTARRSVKQTARRGTISGSKIRLRGTGNVSELASGRGEITDSSITVRDAGITRKASRQGRIDRSDIDAG